MALVELEAQLEKLENRLMNKDLSVMDAYKISKEIESLEVKIEFEKSSEDKTSPKQWRLKLWRHIKCKETRKGI